MSKGMAELTEESINYSTLFLLNFSTNVVATNNCSINIDGARRDDEWDKSNNCLQVNGDA